MKRKPKGHRRSHQIKPGGKLPRVKIGRGPVRPSGAGIHGGNATQKHRRDRKATREGLRLDDWS